MFQIAKDVLDESQYEMFSQKGQIDFAYDYESTNSDDDVVRRFRVNLFMARGKPAIAARLITSQIMDFESLNLPEVLGDVSMRAQGLILFAGVTGSGKSTSIASMLQYVNQRKRCHIVTIEDPIEYLFQDDKANINQREVGIDCLSFNEALRALVREDPDIVLVGEMRDYETFEAAIERLKPATWSSEPSTRPRPGKPLAGFMTSSQKASENRSANCCPTTCRPSSTNGCCPP